MTKVLEVRNLRTHFNTSKGTVKAVNGISYELEAGETLGIVGESGSGKSVGVMSLMKLIPMPPGEIVEGEAWFEGKDIFKMSESQLEDMRGNSMGMIFQDPMTSLNPIMTVGRQIGEALERHTKMTKDQVKNRTIELLELVGIPMAADRINNYPIQFSGGMRQRVMIAIGLACDPKLLIADEPTTALDVTIQAQITDLIAKLQKELGMSVIWITHDLGVVAGIADRVLVMYAGRIVEEATVEELFKNPRHPYTLGLLKSVPRVDADRPEKLQSIDGMPPDMTKELVGCPFYARCNYRTDKCLSQEPKLEEVGSKHRSACFVDVRSAKRTTENPYQQVTNL